MKRLRIVKSFKSDEYATTMHNRYVEGSTHRQIETATLPGGKPSLEWGLSSEGQLCCRGHFTYCNYPDWSEYESCVFSISLIEMKKIVKEFGHLVIFT